VTAGDLVVVIASVVMIGATVAIALMVSALVRSLRDLQAVLDELRGEAVPLMGELRSTVSAAGAEVDRVDGLLETAEAISARVDGASRVGYLAFRRPMIRLVTIGRGIRRGARRLFLGRKAEPVPARASHGRSRPSSRAA
jgi:hypothetical protein